MGRWDDGKGGLAHREGICQKHRTGEVGTARSPTGPVVLAPDGNALAFVATDIQGRILLWVRKLNDLHASTCAGFGGREFARRAAANPVVIQALSAASGGRIIPVPGGVMIREKAGDIIGAVGISGDTSENDEACAVYGISSAGLVPDTGDPS